MLLTPSPRPRGAGAVATLILPADVSWGDGAARPAPPRRRRRAACADEAVREVADALRTGEPRVLLLGGDALSERGLMAAARIGDGHRGAPAVRDVPGAARPRRRAARRPRGCPTSPRPPLAARRRPSPRPRRRARRWRSSPTPACPETSSPRGARCTCWPSPEDATEALCALADDSSAPGRRRRAAPRWRRRRSDRGADGATLAEALGAPLPAGAIVVDEAVTSVVHMAGATAGCPRHDWLTLTGGAIGQGLPVATGAAVACPDRPVIAIQADGRAMYTIPALWTQAREQLDVTTVICDNGAYAILDVELTGSGAGGGGVRAAAAARPDRARLDFVALATGMGVPARRARTADELVDRLRWALAEPGTAPDRRRPAVAAVVTAGSGAASTPIFRRR